MTSQECISKLSPHLLWDVDREQADMNLYPSYFIQRVLEYGTLEDWYFISSFYGLEKIVSVCMSLRTLDPKALSFICLISDTKKENYRCYHIKQSVPTLWNS